MKCNEQDLLSFYRWMVDNGWEEHSSKRYFFKLEYVSQWPPSEGNTASGEELVKKWREDTRPTK